MGTTADKLNNILNSKAAIKQAIESKGVINVGDILSEYPDKIKQILPSINDVAYGVEWDVTVADPHITRVGNLSYHVSLPIQSKYRGCVCQGNQIIYYLDPTDWSKKDNGEPSVLDGTDGVVRVHTPKFYGRSWEEGNIRRVMITETKLDDTWIEIPEMLIDAYRCTVVNSTIDSGYLSTLPINSAVSVVSTSEKLRGSTNSSSRDIYLSTDIFRTDLGKPRTGINRSTMRTYSRNAGSELMCYEYYKWIFYWAYTIEYASFHSQDTYNSELTNEGYHQGGLGSGISNMSNWNEYNSTTPITPCGYGNSIGNFTGIKSLTIPEFVYTVTAAWFNSWSANSSICTSSNGSNNSKLITSIKSITDYAFYYNPTNVWGTTTYMISGLTNGQKVIFKEKQSGTNYSTATTLLEVDQDGEYQVNWSDYNLNGQKYVGFSQIQETCNITIYNTNRNTTQVTKTQQVLNISRWRGFDNPFGDIWTNLEGIVVKRDSASQPSNVYTTTNPEYFDDNIDNKQIAGIEVAQDGYIKTFDLNETAEIIPSNCTGAGSTTYKCDYHYCNVSYTDKRTVLVGGRAAYGAHCGFGFFRSADSVGYSLSSVGFRTLIKL